MDLLHENKNLNHIDKTPAFKELIDFIESIYKSIDKVEHGRFMFCPDIFKQKCIKEIRDSLSQYELLCLFYFVKFSKHPCIDKLYTDMNKYHFFELLDKRFLCMEKK